MLSNFYTSAIDILSKVENLQTETEYGYSEQKAIMQTPTLVAKGTSLRKYSLPIKLHVNYCNPDDIIAELKQLGENNEVFSYFQDKTYIGEFVIEKVSENILNKYNEKIIYAEITVDLHEADKKKTEYSQQTKTIKNPTTDLKTLGSDTYTSPVSVLTGIKENVDFYKSLTNTVLNSALRQGV